jgi:hypothetical protein
VLVYRTRVPAHLWYNPDERAALIARMESEDRCPIGYDESLVRGRRHPADLRRSVEATAAASTPCAAAPARPRPLHRVPSCRASVRTRTWYAMRALQHAFVFVRKAIL